MLTSVSAFFGTVKGFRYKTCSRSLFVGNKGVDYSSSPPSSWTSSIPAPAKAKAKAKAYSKHNSPNRRRTRSFREGRGLQMHLGHSHSHHHHHTHDEVDHDHDDFHRYDVNRNRPQDGPSSGIDRYIHTYPSKCFILSMLAYTSKYLIQSPACSKLPDPLPIGWGKIVQLPRNNPQTRVFLCAILFLIPIAIRRSLTKVDLSVFAVLSITLSFFEDAKRSLKSSLRKLSEFQQSMSKHTTPMTKAYFFKNENSADRVTLLGAQL